MSELSNVDQAILDALGEHGPSFTRELRRALGRSLQAHMPSAAILKRLKGLHALGRVQPLPGYGRMARWGLKP